MRSIVALSIFVILVAQPIAFAQTTNSTNQTSNASTNQTSSFNPSNQTNSTNQTSNGNLSQISSPSFSSQTVNNINQDEINGPGGLMSLSGLPIHATIPSDPLQMKEHPPAHIKKFIGPSLTSLGGQLSCPISSISCDSPAIIWTAYGFNKLGCTYTAASWPNSNLCGNGQTIGIVDAFDDPNIASDLATFDSQFGLPACTVANGCFEKLEPQGTPSTNSLWAFEISLDVEWAHSIAPGAKIALVESSTNTLGNLLGGVDAAAVGVGAQQVSNSWGGGEFPTESSLDSHFNSGTASFFVASGDGGNGVEWPAASPYVISVGGTTLVTDSSGKWVSETAWSGSGGGISADEPKPSYQNNFNTNSNRAVPDVAYDGDPNTGVYVYDTVPLNGNSGWFVAGGTSAGAPQWTGISAIANSQHARLASASFGTSNALYGAAAGAQSSPQTNPYLLNYHDITTGSNGNCGSICNAGKGYDEVTGLGSPQANNLIQYLTPTCGVSSSSTLNFGLIAPGHTSQEQKLALTNTGTTSQATLQVSGTNWIDNTQTVQMLVGQTSWSLTSGGTQTALSASPNTITNNFATGTPLSTFWEVTVPPFHAGLQGTLTQTMTFIVSC